MGLTVAELVATLGADASDFDQGLDGLLGKFGPDRRRCDRCGRGRRRGDRRHRRRRHPLRRPVRRGLRLDPHRHRRDRQGAGRPRGRLQGSGLLRAHRLRLGELGDHRAEPAPRAHRRAAADALRAVPRAQPPHRQRRRRERAPRHAPLRRLVDRREGSVGRPRHALSRDAAVGHRHGRPHADGGRVRRAAAQHGLRLHGLDRHACQVGEGRRQHLHGADRHEVRAQDVRQGGPRPAERAAEVHREDQGGQVGDRSHGDRRRGLRPARRARHGRRHPRGALRVLRLRQGDRRRQGHHRQGGRRHRRLARVAHPAQEQGPRRARAGPLGRLRRPLESGRRRRQGAHG